MGVMPISGRTICVLGTGGGWKRVLGVPGIGVLYSCESLCGFRESTLGPLEEQPVLRTAEPSLQPQGQISKANLETP